MGKSTGPKPPRFQEIQPVKPGEQPFQIPVLGNSNKVGNMVRDASLQNQLEKLRRGQK